MAQDRYKRRMGRRAAIGLYICVLALWTQLFVPVAALSMQPSVDPFSVICSHSQNGGPTDQDHHKHGHDCCVLCHAHVGFGALFERPVYTAFDYPVSSPLRWQAGYDAPRPTVLRRTSLARGPPSLV